MQTLAIDIGNTRTKLARFDEAGRMAGVTACSTAQIVPELEQFLAAFDPAAPLRAGWISVSAELDLAALPLWGIWKGPLRLHRLTAQSPMPLHNRYRTPATLGADRIVAVAGARMQAPGSPLLVIDAGTAITYDAATAAGEYLGGAIAPGIRMRFRALHEFTARLPLAEPEPEPALVGSSTLESLQSGVLWGIVSEAEGMIARYRDRLGGDLQVFLTGGDTPHFEKHLKSVNFADANLTLKGIYHILSSPPYV
ncbi:MAG: type III pantothenate kinase [Bacteroidia bacterium]|nr:type III pantothenate kinase [Bacteroidia bacterium]